MITKDLKSIFSDFLRSQIQIVHDFAASRKEPKLINAGCFVGSLAISPGPKKSHRPSLFSLVTSGLAHIPRSMLGIVTCSRGSYPAVDDDGHQKLNIEPKTEEVRTCFLADIVNNRCFV